MSIPKQLTLDEWDSRYDALKESGLKEPDYGGRLSRHLDDVDYRLRHLRFDNSPEALRLWNFLLTEEERLLSAKQSGKRLVGAMKDRQHAVGLGNEQESGGRAYPCDLFEDQGEGEERRLHSAVLGGQ